MGKEVKKQLVYCRSILALALLPFIVSCAEEFGPDFEDPIVTEATGISILVEVTNISESTAIVWDTEITPLNATVKKILWSSDNPSIATVDEKGRIEGHSPGTAKITATLEDNTAIFDVLELTVNDGTFITTWDRTTEVVIPTNPSMSYHYDVDWDNDGTFDDLGLTGNASHTFSTTGPHTVRIRGQFPAIQFGTPAPNGTIVAFDSRMADKIVAVNQWGNIDWESMALGFTFCKNLEFPASDVPNFSRVTSMTNMLRGATIANPDVSHWDVAHVTDMSLMFVAAKAANPDVSQWNVANVTDMSLMFLFAETANPDVSQWNTSKVTNMAAMFLGAFAAEPDVSHWNVARVTNMESMFENATIANPNVRHWEIPNVIHMSNLFSSSGMSPENYTAALVSFSSQPTQHNVSLTSTGTRFCNEQNESVIDAKAILESRNWNIQDNGPMKCLSLF